MRIIRNLLYADVPTHCGKVFSLISLETLAYRINTDDIHRLGYLIREDDCMWFRTPISASHKVLNATVKDGILIAVIEFFDTIIGRFLFNNQKSYIFRPDVEFYEGNDHFSLTNIYYGVNAFSPNLDYHDSFKVLWDERPLNKPILIRDF